MVTFAFRVSHKRGAYKGAVTRCNFSCNLSQQRHLYKRSHITKQVVLRMLH